jgi:hypothetical protein
MLIKQGRIFAVTVEEALEQIHAKHGEGIIYIREANVQPNSDLIWYEYNIEMEGGRVDEPIQ